MAMILLMVCLVEQDSRTGKTLFRGTSNLGLYSLPSSMSSHGRIAYLGVRVAGPIWHSRLGKSVKLPFQSSLSVTHASLALIHSDCLGLFPTSRLPRSPKATTLSRPPLPTHPHLYPIPPILPQPLPPKQPNTPHLVLSKFTVAPHIGPSSLFPLLTLTLFYQVPQDTHHLRPLLGHANKFQEWRTAMGEEFNALQRAGTGVLVPPKPTLNVLPNKWVFRIKRNSDGSVQRYKACLVANGFHQQEGLDYGETFSPVVNHSTILILALSIKFQWPVCQLDVHNAFLHGYLDEEAMTRPTSPHSFKT
ncbi:unnamed protein product [Prunus armeniaca]